MFGINKEELIKGLKVIRLNSCAYMGENFCDCKYGINTNKNFPYGEQNGCPELRSVISILENMTDDEYLDLCKRSKIMITR